MLERYDVDLKAVKRDLSKKDGVYLQLGWDYQGLNGLLAVLLFECRKDICICREQGFKIFIIVLLFREC